ncbi:MAG: helix-turn-helix domain-containing protein [Dehalococcoidales bacterium]|nr:helix-turn-helix domain-containing protein [Dehalococcoidales bacterium]
MKQMRQSKNRVTVKDVADYCLVNRVTVRRWIRGGKLSAIRLPSGHYRISIVDFRDFLEGYHIPVEDWLLESKSEKEGGKQ